MLRDILLLSLVCWVLALSSAHENDYLDTERNRKLLQYKPPLFARSDLALFYPKTSFFKSQSQNNEFSFREDVDERVNMLTFLKQGLSDDTLRQALDDVTENDLSLLQCRNDTQLFVMSALMNTPWAIQMFDAYGKPGSRMLQGNFKMYGSFDECLQIKAMVSPPEVRFRGKYCVTTLNPYPGQTGILAQQMALGICIPDTCSQNYTNIVVNELLSNLQIKFYAGIQCVERDYPLDTSAIVAIVICAIFGCLVVTGTVYDVIVNQALKSYKGSRLRDPNKYGTLSKIRTTSQRANSEKSPLISDLTTSSVVDSCDVGLVAEEDTKPGIGAQVLMSFSAYTNGAKLLDTKQPTGSLTAVHGIRFLSMTWVILGHAYMTLIMVADTAAPYFQAAVKRWTFHAIINALVSVDSFFALSGLLVTYLTMKELRKTEGKVNWFMFYFHRYWRLTPVYMFSLMIFVCIFHYFGDGPLWQQRGFSVDHCSDTWWTNLLYVNNLVKRDKMCFGWSWYLANDMQFYILSPIILLPLYYFPLIGYIVFGAFLVATMTAAGVISHTNNLAPGIIYQVVGKAGDYNDYYMTPYCRMGPYLVGMAAGYFLYRVNRKFKMTKATAICGWLIATASALAVLYGPYDSANGTPMTKDIAALYNAVHRTVWGAAVCWVVVACATGNGGYVNTILSWKGFVPLSRLSYSAYLIHLPVEMMFTYSLRRPPFIGDVNLTYNYLGMLLMSYGVALVVSLTFEAPMLGLEKTLLKRGEKK